MEGSQYLNRLNFDCSSSLSGLLQSDAVLQYRTFMIYTCRVCFIPHCLRVLTSDKETTLST